MKFAGMKKYADFSKIGSVVNEKVEGENHRGYKYTLEKKSMSDFTIIIAYGEAKKGMCEQAKEKVLCRLFGVWYTCDSCN